MKEKEFKPRKRAKKVGLPPGTMVYIGEKRTEAIRITSFLYNETTLEEKIVASADDCVELYERAKATKSILWLNIDGLHDLKVVEKIGSIFGLHPLVLEDIVNTTQRPKRMDYDTYIFMCLRLLEFSQENCRIDTDQMSLILGENYVLSFQELAGDCLDPLRERIRQGKGRVRKSGADYLFYALTDSIIDSYFIILEQLGEGIQELEDQVLDNTDPETLNEVHHYRRQMMYVRRAVWPLREMISGLAREELVLICQSTRLFLRDVYDHTIEVIEIVEMFRDMLGGMIELYMSNLSNKVNSVMRTLTVIATIFMPLTFIVGVYGMNFDNMPELHMTFGYYGVWAVMVGIAIGMLYFFRRREWI